MKRVLVFLAVYTGTLALVVVILALLLFAYVAVGNATGIAFGAGSIPALLLIMLLVGVFSSWLTRKILRSRVSNTQNSN